MSDTFPVLELLAQTATRIYWEPIDYLRVFVGVVGTIGIAYAGYSVRFRDQALTFVSNYRVMLWGSPELGFPAFIGMPLGTLIAVFCRFVPDPFFDVAVQISYIILFGSAGAGVFLGFVWFPHAWTPRWYRQGIRAGIDKNNDKDMHAFRLLSQVSQERLASEGNWLEVRASVFRWMRNIERYNRYKRIPRYLLEDPTFTINGKKPEVIIKPREEEIFESTLDPRPES